MKIRDYKFFMDVAVRASLNSTSQRLKVGAVLVKDGNILAIAWNGTPPGWDNCCEEEVDGVLVTKPTTLHAEKNILRKMANSHNVVSGSTLIMTHNLCPVCTADYIGLGLTELVYKDEYRITSGLELLNASGTLVRKYSDIVGVENA